MVVWNDMLFITPYKLERAQWGSPTMEFRLLKSAGEFFWALSFSFEKRFLLFIYLFILGFTGI